ncbi:hypothetical protein D3C85_1334880 [compost metagenome]
MDDAVHIRPRAVHPAVEAVGRVGHALSFEHFQVFVDQQQVAGSDFVESQAQLLGVEGARLRTAGADLPGKAGVVAVVEQNPAGQCQLFAHSPRIIGKRALHLLKGLLDQLVLGECHCLGHGAILGGVMDCHGWPTPVAWKVTGWSIS